MTRLVGDIIDTLRMILSMEQSVTKVSLETTSEWDQRLG